MSSVKRCSCGALIRFLALNDKDGKKSPITNDPTGKGNIALNSDGLSYRVLTGEELQTYRGPRFLNHFSDCEDAKRYGGTKPGNPAYRESPKSSSSERQSELFSVKDPGDYTR